MPHRDQVSGYIRCGGVPARFPAPKPDVEEPEFIQRIIERGRALFGRTGKWDQFGMPIIEQRRRRNSVSPRQIARPGADVRYLTALAVERYDEYLSIPEPELSNAIEYLIPVKRPSGVDPRQATPGGRRTDREIWRDLSILEADIRAGMRHDHREVRNATKRDVAARAAVESLGGEAAGQSSQHLPLLQMR